MRRDGAWQEFFFNCSCQLLRGLAKTSPQHLPSTGTSGLRHKYRRLSCSRDSPLLHRLHVAWNWVRTAAAPRCGSASSPFGRQSWKVNADACCYSCLHSVAEALSFKFGTSCVVSKKQEHLCSCQNSTYFSFLTENFWSTSTRRDLNLGQLVQSQPNLLGPPPSFKSRSELIQVIQQRLITIYGLRF